MNSPWPWMATSSAHPPPPPFPQVQALKQRVLASMQSLGLRVAGDAGPTGQQEQEQQGQGQGQQQGQRGAARKEPLLCVPPELLLPPPRASVGGVTATSATTAGTLGQWQYVASPDGHQENVLLLLHGLGDTPVSGGGGSGGGRAGGRAGRVRPPSDCPPCPLLLPQAPYVALARKLRLPATCCLALGGPLEVPETGGGRAWFEGLDEHSWEPIQVRTLRVRKQPGVSRGGAPPHPSPCARTPMRTLPARPPLPPRLPPQPTRTEQRRVRSLARTARLLTRLIDGLVAGGWAHRQISLLGFSQGGCAALEVHRRYTGAAALGG